VDVYPLVFAVSRVSGWVAHVLEQYAANSLMRPLADYTGPTGQKYVPIDQR
jgi:citrate synthase